MPVSQLELEEESLLGEHSEGGYKRRSQPPAPRWRNMLTFVLTAMVSGLVFYLIIFSFILSRPGLREKSKEYLFGTSKGNDAPANATEALANGPVDAEFWDHYIPKPGPDHKSEDGLFDMTADELRAMLASTNGYFARDWSVWLGWNNMRYILEGALMQAQLLNRTLIIPSFVYARACEFHNDVCAKYAKMVNKNDAFYSTEWSSWPIEKQMSFVIPMEMMIDVPHLRKTHKFMMLSEYFHLQGLNASHETTNGQWDRDYYVSGSPKPSMFIIPNHIYDPENIGRVDTFDFPNAPTGQNLTGVAIEYDRRLSEKAQGKKTGIISWKDARDAVSSVGVLQDDAGLEAALRSANWLTMHTFEGDMGMDFTKTVIKPIRQVMRMSDARAWVEDYKHVTQDIVWLQGEVHLGRKAGLMRFTTEEARDTFARIVLHDILPPKRVRDLAATVDKRLNNINKGRAWMASHMRRGDFVTAGWTMESTIEKHYERIQKRLALGRKILEELTPTKWETYNIPDVSVNQELSHRPPPKEGDFIYLATDERSPDGLRYLQEHGALLFDNVVTAQDRRDFGWGLLFTDIIALVEQQIIGHGSSFFYAHAMSSVAGGMVNIRAANGADRRSNMID